MGILMLRPFNGGGFIIQGSTLGFRVWSRHLLEDQVYSCRFFSASFYRLSEDVEFSALVRTPKPQNMSPKP